MKRSIAGIFVVFLAGFGAVPLVAQNSEGDSIPAHPACNAGDLYCPATTYAETAKILQNFSAPEISPPESAIVTPAISVRNPIGRTVTYDIATRGAITADLDTFKAQANQTLNDERGWSRLGVQFAEVASGGEFTLVLSEASQLPTFWAGCSIEYSCQTGRYVVINQDRWQSGTPTWNDAGGGLREYRHMVINHETGHWLGHGHSNCPSAGQAATVMQQQSINLQGCKFNPWPLDSEIWSSRLGV